FVLCFLQSGVSPFYLLRLIQVLRHCNSSYFTMVAKDHDGNNVEVPGLIVKDKTGLRRFARSKERKLSAHDRDSKYKSGKFKVNEYLDFLDGENVKLDLD
ncbi:MAG: hypothetical protein AAGL29_12270, partial [Bacteroidota bacterium]